MVNDNYFVNICLFLLADNVDPFRPICCTFPDILWPKSCVLKYANRRLETEMSHSVTEKQPTVRSVSLRDNATAFNTFRELSSGSGTEG